jgi:16S rRNA (cytosine967-C5)-methyltransferase
MTPAIKEMILHTLELVFTKGLHVDKALAMVFSQNKGQHKEEVAEAIFDLLNNWRFLWACRQQEPSTDEQALKTALWTWELLQKEQAPEHKDRQLIWNQRGSMDKVALSVPAWLYEWGYQQSGEAWRKELAAMNQPAKTVLRVNTLKIDRDHLRKQMPDSAIVDWAPEALAFSEHTNLYARAEFHQGLFEVQDASSQAVSLLLRVEPGQRVVDACAGAGGKSLHLAALMKNKGRIISLDTSDRKLAELRRRARRAGVSIIDTRLIDSSKAVKRLYDSADRLLLDVPCSGTGVLHRNPDLRWRLSETMLKELMEKQKQILSQYSKILKKDGRMVYATCSLLTCEGEEQIAWFLQQNPDTFQLVEEKRFSPAKDGFDGFYAAVLTKKE